MSLQNTSSTSLMELLFINDIPVHIATDTALAMTGIRHDCIDYYINNPPPTQIIGTFVFEPDAKVIENWFAYFQTADPSLFQRVTIRLGDQQYFRDWLAQYFQVVEAAGGVVSQDSHTLMIHRLGKWDLPKGKLMPGEEYATAAVREVEEECNVRVQCLDELCTTWHTYIRQEAKILKKTVWYAMTCLDDKDMQPQQEEGIDKVAWMEEDAVAQALQQSYASIRHVWQAYHDYRAKR